MRIPATRNSGLWAVLVVVAVLGIVASAQDASAQAGNCLRYINTGTNPATRDARLAVWNTCNNPANRCRASVQVGTRTVLQWKTTGSCAVCQNLVRAACGADYEPGDLIVRLVSPLPDDATNVPPSEFVYDGGATVASRQKFSFFRQLQNAAYGSLRSAIEASLGRGVDSSSDSNSIRVQRFDSDPLLFSITGVSEQEILRLRSAFGSAITQWARRARQFTHSQYGVLFVTPAPTPSAIPGRESKPSVNPLQWGLSNRGRGGTIGDADGRVYGLQEGVDIDIVNAWAIEGGTSTAPGFGTSLGRRNVVVAVIDDGFNLRGAEFRPNLYVNALEIPCNGIDDDQNGYIDDRTGWDAVLKHGCYDRGALSETASGLGSGGKGHGTHVASIIASVPSQSGASATGVAPFISILPIKAFNNEFGAYYSDALIEAYRHILELKKQGVPIAVVNTSYTGSCAALGELEQNSIKALVEAGITVVGAAGNEGANGLVDPQCPGSLGATTQDPGGVKGAISVAMSAPGPECAAGRGCSGATKLLSWSNYGSTVNTAAPGAGVYANGEFRSGTSMAAPHVAGIVALMYSVNPFISPATVEAILSDPANSKPMEFPVQSKGLISAKNAVGQAARGVIAFKVENDSGGGIANARVAFRDVTLPGSKVGARMSRTDASGFGFFPLPRRGTRLEIVLVGGGAPPQTVTIGDNTTMLRFKLGGATGRYQVIQ